MKSLMSLFVVCCFLSLSAGDIDILQAVLSDRTISTSGPYSLGAMLTPYRDGYLWKNPTKRFSSFIDLGCHDIQPMSCYELSLELLPPQGMKMLLRASYINEDGEESNPDTIDYFSNSSSFSTHVKKIFTPAGVEQMRLDMVIFGDKSFETLGRTLGFVKRISLRHLGPQVFRADLAPFYGKNLLPLSNFRNLPLGENRLNALKLMPFGLRPFKAVVVKSGDEQVLKVTYVPGDYQYLAWFTPLVPAYGASGMARCRIRGKGRIQFMVWYNRPQFSTLYKHYGFFDLDSEDWEEYQIPFGCDDPLVQKIAFAIACRDRKAEFEVSDIHLELTKPQSNKK